MARGKRYRDAIEKVDRTRQYAPAEAVQPTETAGVLIAGTETPVGGASVATVAVVLPVPDAGQ